uniref:FGF n=1 Tax=Parastrongyloides trichosuri TaxID=131310 RepID=A0A0N4ZXZ4_PARTI
MSQPPSTNIGFIPSSSGNVIDNIFPSSSLTYNFVPPSLEDNHKERIQKCKELLNRYGNTWEKNNGKLNNNKIYDRRYIHIDSSTPHRQGALWCRSGQWLEILDKESTERGKRFTDNEYMLDSVRGTRNETSIFTVLEFISIAFGLISIRGMEANRFLCMNRDGIVYGTETKDFNYECIFREEMMENYYNLYSSCAYGTEKKFWYIAIRRNGKVKKGRMTRRNRKSSHFMMVHFDRGRNRHMKGVKTHLQRSSRTWLFPIRNDKEPMSVATAIRTPFYRNNLKGPMKEFKNNQEGHMYILSELIANSIYNNKSKHIDKNIDKTIIDNEEKKTNFDKKRNDFMERNNQYTEVLFKDKKGIIVSNDKRDKLREDEKQERIFYKDYYRTIRLGEIKNKYAVSNINRNEMRDKIVNVRRLQIKKFPLKYNTTTKTTITNGFGGEW